MNVQNILLSIIIKSPDTLASRRIQCGLKIPHQPEGSRLCLFLDTILLVDGDGTLRDAIFLIGGLGLAKGGIEEAVEALGEAVGMVNVDCFLQSLVREGVPMGQVFCCINRSIEIGCGGEKIMELLGSKEGNTCHDGGARLIFLRKVGVFGLSMFTGRGRCTVNRSCRGNMDLGGAQVRILKEKSRSGGRGSFKGD